MRSGASTGQLVTYLVRESVDRHAERSRQTEITDLQLAPPVDEQILGFEIPVQNTVVVAERDTLRVSIVARSSLV